MKKNLSAITSKYCICNIQRCFVCVVVHHDCVICQRLESFVCFLGKLFVVCLALSGHIVCWMKEDLRHAL